MKCFRKYLKCLGCLILQNLICGEAHMKTNNFAEHKPPPLPFRVFRSDL